MAWIRLKRVALIVVGAIAILLGAGSAVSALLGYYDRHIGLAIAIGLCGMLLMALGVFLFRFGLRGPDRDVSDADLM